MKSKVIVAEPFTLGDLIGSLNIEGDIEIINECNETLVTLAYVEDNVCDLQQILNEDLLGRMVLKQGVRDGRMLIKVEGLEDAI